MSNGGTVTEDTTSNGSSVENNREIPILQTTEKSVDVDDINVTPADAGFILPTENHSLITEYVNETENGYERRLALVKSTGVDGIKKWGIYIQHDTTKKNEYVFKRTTPVWSQAKESTTSLLQIMSYENIVGGDSKKEQYIRRWREGNLDTIKELFDSLDETENDEGIEAASTTFHKHRMQQADGEFTVQTEHAVQISPTRIAVKVNVFDETRIIELPSLDTPRETNAWETHRAILQQNNNHNVLNNDDRHVIRIDDYIGNNVTISITDENTTGNITEKGRIQCRIDGSDSEITLYTVQQYLTDKRDADGEQAWVRYHTSDEWNASGNPSQYHHAIDSSDGSIAVAHVLDKEIHPSLANVNESNHENAELNELSMFAAYHMRGNGIECTTRIDKEKTTKDTLHVEFTATEFDMSFSKSYDLPKPGVDAPVTERLVTELGGGEVKYVDGETVYAMPEQAHKARNVTRKFAGDSETLQTTSSENTADTETWVLLTPSQYRFWNGVEAHEKKLEVITGSDKLVKPLAHTASIGAAVTAGSYVLTPAIPSINADYGMLLIGGVTVMAVLSLLLVIVNYALNEYLSRTHENVDIVKRYREQKLPTGLLVNKEISKTLKKFQD